ncbi:hypothetical protein JCM16303_002033 [Sporobolomyces ruberrimus]
MSGHPRIVIGPQRLEVGSHWPVWGEDLFVELAFTRRALREGFVPQKYAVPGTDPSLVFYYKCMWTSKNRNQSPCEFHVRVDTFQDPLCVVTTEIESYHCHHYKPVGDKKQKETADAIERLEADVQREALTAIEEILKGELRTSSDNLTVLEMQEQVLEDVKIALGKDAMENVTRNAIRAGSFARPVPISGGPQAPVSTSAPSSSASKRLSIDRPDPFSTDPPVPRTSRQTPASTSNRSRLENSSGGQYLSAAPASTTPGTSPPHIAPPINSNSSRSSVKRGRDSSENAGPAYGQPESLGPRNTPAYQRGSALNAKGRQSETDDHKRDAESSEGSSSESESEESESEEEDEVDKPRLLRKPRSSSTLRPPSFFDRSVARVFPLSLTVKQVLKCVLAYFLASLFTFIPALSDFVGAPWDVDGPVRNAHAIATVSVYFMPAKTIGGIFEVDIFLFFGAIYAVFLTTSSMAFSMLCERLDILSIGHLFVLVFWLGGGYGLMVYMKVSLAKPTISTACSLISLVCSPIITKEGAYHEGKFNGQVILQVLLIAFFGSLISNAVCLLVWPQSATSKLQTDLNRTLTSFSTLVDMLTKTFLLDDVSTRPQTLQKAIDVHQSTFTTLKASLSQAKYEIFDSRMSGTTRVYDSAVSSMTRLAQGLTGMRAGCSLQWDLLKAQEEAKRSGKKGGQLEKDKQVLDKFRERAGPSLRQLAHTSKQVLSFLRTSFVGTKPGRSHRKALEHEEDHEAGPLLSESLLHLRSELEQSLVLFKREHSRAVKILYRSLPSETVYDARDLIDSDPFADPESLPEQDSGDNLFRIYHFCFNFEEWAAELLQLVDVFVQLRSTEEEVAKAQIAIRKKWGFLTPLVRLVWLKNAPSASNNASVRHQFARALRPAHEKRRNFVFPEIVDGALTSHQLSDLENRTILSKLKFAFWKIGYYLRQPNILFAIKTGGGAALLASPAFIPSLRPLWLTWRGEWSLISYIVIMAPSLGATNFLAAGRVLGTALGAGVAVAFYSAFPENPYVLPILGALFSAPNFYVAVTKPQFAPASRFVLLTYNLTVLYAFNLREHDVPIFSIAFHRSIAVAFGVIYGLIITSYVWPYEARRELRKGLAEFFVNTSHLYERLVRTYSAPPPSLSKMSTRLECPDERTSLLDSQALQELSEAEADFVSMEVQLQMTLIRVSGLLAATPHEPRLKGPFPVAQYRQVLTSCQVILDTFTAVAKLTHRKQWFSSVRRDFIIPVNNERREMVGTVVLYLSLLASAVSLKSPLPPFLPPAADARERLVSKLHELEVVQKRLVRGGSDSLLYLAYVLAMKDIITELDKIGRAFQSLFGIIGGITTEDFDSLFISSPSPTAATSDVEDGNTSDS